MKVKIAATQMSCDWEIENNLNKAIKLVETAAQKGANILSGNTFGAAPGWNKCQQSHLYFLSNQS